MLPQEIIRKKRNGQSLLKEEIDCFVKGLLDQSFSDSQINSSFEGQSDVLTLNLERNLLAVEPLYQVVLQYQLVPA